MRHIVAFSKVFVSLNRFFILKIEKRFSKNNIFEAKSCLYWGGRF